MASGATATLRTGDLSLSYAPLESVANVERLPYSLRILLENALRFESESGAEAVAQWEPLARLPPLTRVAAGLHRRPRDRRRGRDAQRDGRPRRRPRQDQPAYPGRT